MQEYVSVNSIQSRLIESDVDRKGEIEPEKKPQPKAKKERPPAKSKSD
jgi:hypothetical protein